MLVRAWVHPPVSGRGHLPPVQVRGGLPCSAPRPLAALHLGDLGVLELIIDTHGLGRVRLGLALLPLLLLVLSFLLLFFFLGLSIF